MKNKFTVRTVNSDQIPELREPKYKPGDQFVVEVEGVWEENIAMYTTSAPEMIYVYKFKGIPGLYAEDHLGTFRRLDK